MYLINLLPILRQEACKSTPKTSTKLKSKPPREPHKFSLGKAQAAQQRHCRATIRVGRMEIQQITPIVSWASSQHRAIRPREK